MIYVVVGLLVAAFLLGAVAFVATLSGMGPWSRAMLSDDTISRLLKLALILFLSCGPLLVWHWIDPLL